MLQYVYISSNNHIAYFWRHTYTHVCVFMSFFALFSLGFSPRFLPSFCISVLLFLYLSFSFLPSFFISLFPLFLYSCCYQFFFPLFLYLLLSFHPVSSFSPVFSLLISFCTQIEADMRSEVSLM